MKSRVAALAAAAISMLALAPANASAAELVSYCSSGYTLEAALLYDVAFDVNANGVICVQRKGSKYRLQDDVVFWKLY